MDSIISVDLIRPSYDHAHQTVRAWLSAGHDVGDESLDQLIGWCCLP